MTGTRGVNQKQNQKQKDIWVYIEPDKDGVGIRKSSYEMISLGKMLSEKLGASLSGVAVGSEVFLKKSYEEGKSRGLSRLISVKDDVSPLFQLERYAASISYIVDKYSPVAILFSASQQGRDLAPALSVRTKYALIADCQDVRAFKTRGEIVWKRASFSGSLISDVVVRKGCGQVVTVRPGLFPKAEKLTEDRDMDWLQEEAPLDIYPASLGMSELIEVLQENVSNQVDLEDAEVIVSGGRGAGGSEGFRLIKELADVLGGQVGASRVAVDKGWIDHWHLIGQSGKTVAPKLYINCGISGSVQHITGMRDAGCVVSINTDPKALIFNVSDYSLVGDMFQVLPVLIEEIKKLKRDK